MRTITYAQAALEAIAEEMRREPKSFHLAHRRARSPC